MRRCSVRSCELLALVALTACGTDADTTPLAAAACESSILSYENFGEPFMLD